MFLRYKTLASAKLHLGWSQHTVLKASSCVRQIMVLDAPRTLSGTVEVDETFIGGMWHNKRWSTRKYGTKRGRGTSKQAIFGLFERDRHLVYVCLIGNLLKKTLMPLILQHIEKGSTIYSDGYQLYQQTPKYGYTHDWVDHTGGEYGRGQVHTNNIEGFWGLLKRRLKTTGGIRRDRLHLYLAEEVWRFNNRQDTEDAQVERLLCLLEEKFGG